MVNFSDMVAFLLLFVSGLWLTGDMGETWREKSRLEEDKRRKNVDTE